MKSNAAVCTKTYDFDTVMAENECTCYMYGMTGRECTSYDTTMAENRSINRSDTNINIVYCSIYNPKLLVLGWRFFCALVPGTLALDLSTLILCRPCFFLSLLSVTTEFVSLWDESGRTVGAGGTADVVG